MVKMKIIYTVIFKKLHIIPMVIKLSSYKKGFCKEIEMNNV